jgi:dipeptide/tripeptide permease
LDYVYLTDIYQNGVHLGWQLIQIFVVSLGEIMFSISGISFAYSQAPASMKSVIQSLWYMTIAIGNLIVIIVAESRFIKSQVYEYVFFAGLLGVATIIFLVLSYFYKYTDEPSQDGNNTNKVAPVADKKPPEQLEEIQA